MYQPIPANKLRQTILLLISQNEIFEIYGLFTEFLEKPANRSFTLLYEFCLRKFFVETSLPCKKKIKTKGGHIKQ